MSDTRVTVWVVATSDTAARWGRALADAKLEPLVLPWGTVVAGPDAENVRPALDADASRWIVVTSASALRFLPDDVGAGRHTACVGPHTANAATERGFVVGLLGTEGGAALAHQLVGGPGPTRALVLRSRTGRDDVESILSASGWEVEVLDTYAVEPDAAFAARIANAPAPRAAVIGSPRAARALQVALGARDDLDIEALSHVVVGETTAQALRDEGCARVAVADHPTPLALVATVQRVVLPQEL